MRLAINTTIHLHSAGKNDWSQRFWSGGDKLENRRGSSQTSLTDPPVKWWLTKHFLLKGSEWSSCGEHDAASWQDEGSGQNLSLNWQIKFSNILHEFPCNHNVQAKTLCNERSSRSHSVFILKIEGHNTSTLETCCGVLNLVWTHFWLELNGMREDWMQVDLAGSERIKESGSEGVRLTEAQVQLTLGNSESGKFKLIFFASFLSRQSTRAFQILARSSWHWPRR